ncbi:hypothetical protein EDD21DRAFT_375764 [Dissophora ornata]|nr:hypothetical protein BGZ58_003006 [Dissophora ornata]KAI8600976.1 hypothetical protein EDD21DRAFT_375764 [Dissophora ornata]
MIVNEPIYIVKDVPGKGRGMFATRDIHHGECIISEEPLVFVVPNLVVTMVSIQAMSKKNKKSFYALHNVHQNLPTELGIVKTNALPLGQDAVDAAVYRVISRINHSCSPNVRHSWNSKKRKECIYAVREIEEGSEILTCYFDPLSVRKERKKFLLENFKFDCQCSICAVSSSSEYDAIVTRINICSDLIMKYAGSNPKMAMQLVREVVRLLDSIGGPGGLGRKTAFYYDGYQLSAMYSDYKLAQEWADLLLESYRMGEGEDGVEYERYLQYSRNPRSHERAGMAGRLILS